jgi:NADH-quinone oxidoreductase subunit J
MGQAIAFWILAIVVIGAALGVIFQRNVFRAALSLILCLVGVAGIFITLSADFLAAAQILIYVGAVSVFIILAIMLTRDFSHGNPSNRSWFPAFLLAAVFFGLVAWAVLNTNWIVSTTPPQTPTTQSLAERIFSENGFILPLEISGVILMAVVIGAIVLAREK